MDAPTLPSVQTVGYTPSGRRMYFSITAGSIAELIAKAFELDTQLAAAGLSVREPGLNEGEMRETIHHVVRRAKDNGDGTETPILDLYPDKLAFKFLTIYLNTPADIQAFENVSGVKLFDIPLLASDTAIERFKNGARDKQYVVALPAPAGVIWKNNPRYEGDTDKKHPKRVFVRWADAAPPTPPTTPAAAEQPAQPKNSAPSAQATNGKPDALQTLKARVMREINKDLTEVQIAALAGIKAFSNAEEWRTKFGGLDKAFAAIKAEYEFQNLGDLSQVEF